MIIAAAGGAAHLAGVMAAHTTLPVLGVPMRSESLNGLDSLLATVQMPGGIPVGTLAIGKPGAVNAALFAVAILANSRPELRKKLHEFREVRKLKSVLLSFDAINSDLIKSLPSSDCQLSSFSRTRRTTCEHDRPDSFSLSNY